MVETLGESAKPVPMTALSHVVLCGMDAAFEKFLDGGDHS